MKLKLKKRGFPPSDFDEDNEEEIEEDSPDDDEVQESLDIDLYNLHLEAKRSGELIRKFSKIMVSKKLKYDKEKAGLKAVEFEVAKRIKKNPKIYGLTESKVTDTMLKFTIPSSKLWQGQFKRMSKAEGEWEHWKNIVEACKTKSFDIRIAFQMWESNYYGDVDLKRKELK